MGAGRAPETGGGSILALSWIWGGMVLIAVAFALLNGSAGALGTAALEGAEAAVQLCLKLAGPLCLWAGVNALLERAGALGALARLLRPLLGRLFPTARKDPAASAALTANFSANLLGLGNAATPAGIAAARRLSDGTGTATAELCRLVVLNTASVQLLPTTVCALRAGLGASAPFDILPAVWLSSLCSVAAGLLAARLLEKRWRG